MAVTLLEDFQHLIEGGLQENTIYLVRGVPASGKTLFALTLMRELAERGRTVVYLTTELSPEDLRDHVKHGFGWELGELEKQGKLILLDGYSWKVGKCDHDSHRVDLTNLSEMSASLACLTQELKQKPLPEDGRPFFFVFDTLSSLVLYNDLTTVIKFMQIQVARFREAKVSSLLLLEEGIDDQPVMEKLSFSVDGMFETKLLEAHGELHRYLRILAVRRAMHYTGWVQFQSTKEGFKFVTPLRERMWEAEAKRP